MKTYINAEVSSSQNVCLHCSFVLNWLSDFSLCAFLANFIHTFFAHKFSGSNYCPTSCCFFQFCLSSAPSPFSIFQIPNLHNNSYPLMKHLDVKINIDGRFYGQHCKHHILAVLLNIKYEYKNLLTSPLPDMCAEKFPLVSIGGWAEGLACTDQGGRTPIGASGNYLCLIAIEAQGPAKKV